MTSDENIYTLHEMLEDIEDYRKDRGIRYKLADLLLLCLYAILSGKQNALNIAYYVELNFEYFKELISLNRIPSHDTFSKVLRYTNFEKLSDCFNEWLDFHFPEIANKYGRFKLLHVDGKAVRAASEKSNGEKPVYLLNAMYEGGSIRVYSKKIGEKENEITHLPGFLNMLNLENTIVTVDAMGDNTTVINAIIENKGDYITTVKENQGNLYRAIESECKRLKEELVIDEFDNKEINKFETLERFEVTEKDHGRIDTYKVKILPSTSFIYEKYKTALFYGTIGKVAIIDKKSLKKDKGEWVETNTQSYIISSVEDLSAKRLLEIKRSHWNLEMQHWLLDVHYKEDQLTARRDNAIINASALKRFAMRIKKENEEFNKLTLERFFMYCFSNVDNITKILFAREKQNNS